MQPLTRAKTRPLTTRSAAAAAALTHPRVTWAPLPLTEMAKAKAKAKSWSQSLEKEKESVSVAAKRKRKREDVRARQQRKRKEEEQESGKPSREVLREWVKKAKITVGEEGEAVGDELEDASPRVTTWRVQQDLLGGSTSPAHPNLNNIEADRHLSLVEFYSQLTYQVKDRVHSAAAATPSVSISFSEAGPLPYWIKIALLKMRGVVEIYEKKGEVGPYQRYVWERAKLVVDELEEMWCEDIERIWRWEEEEVERRNEGAEEEKEEQGGRGDGSDGKEAAT